MTVIDSLKDRCCGCGACAAACPAACVGMQPDSCGFMRPAVDAAACFDCGLCVRVCPALAMRTEDGLEGAWWAQVCDDELLSRSSSGGVFGLLARHVLDADGVVYGAAFDEGCMSVRHIRVGSGRGPGIEAGLDAETGSSAEEGLDALMRSKYVQSVVCPEVYRGVEADLRAGLPVLFSGTACQVSGMRGFLEAHHAPLDRLLLVDVVCHGVPAPGLWRRWLAYKKSEAQGKVSDVNFRSKVAGWTTFSVAYEYVVESPYAQADPGAPTGSDVAGEVGIQAESHLFGQDWYMRAFLQNASLRDSCLRCPAKRLCGSDLTLGDFWGIAERHPEAFDDRGMSAVIANTSAGMAAFEAVAKGVKRGESTLEAIVFGNSALVRSVTPHKDRERFLAAVADNESIPALMARWPFKTSFSRRILDAASRTARRLAFTRTRGSGR